MTPPRRIVLGICFLFAAPSTRASADASRAVTVVSEADDPVVAESSTRLCAELAAAGFAVVKAPCFVDDDQCSPVAGTSGIKTGSKIAEIKLWRARGAAFILVTTWPDPDTAVQKRVTITSSTEARSAVFLAIQAFDLFQVAAGLNLGKSEGATADAAANAGEGGPPRFAVELGVAVIPSLTGGPGVAGGPAARAWFLRPRHLALALALVGPAYAASLESAQGRASLRQEGASLLACYRPFPGGRVQPSLCGGGGIYHAAIDGRASGATRTLSQDHWTPFADVGLGTFVRLSAHYLLSFQAQSWWLKRYPQILIGGNKVGETGHPALLLVAAVGRVF